MVICSPDYDIHLLQLLEAVSLIGASIPDITLPAAVLPQQRSAPRGRGSSSNTSSRVYKGKPQQQQQQLPYHLANLVLVQCCGKQQEMSDSGLLHLQQMLGAGLGATVWANRQRLLQDRSLASTAAVVAAGSAVAGKAAAGAAAQQQQKQRGGDLAAAAGSFKVWAVPATTVSADVDGGLDLRSYKTDKQQQEQHKWTEPPVQLQQLVHMLLRMPRTVSTAASNAASSNNVNNSSKSSSKGTFSRVISEREWLAGAERVWEAVQNSSELLQYYSLAAVARYAGAGGWRQR